MEVVRVTDGTTVLKLFYRDGLSCSEIDAELGFASGMARRMITSSWDEDFARTKTAYEWREWRHFNDL